MRNEHFSKSAGNLERKIMPPELFIELSNKISEYNKKKSQKNVVILNNDEQEDEDVLKKFNDKKRRKILNKNIITKEKAFSTVRDQIKNEFSLAKLGKIEWAKDHASANRPMNKIQDFTTSTNFCYCCNLPCETPGVIEPFSFCEETENFKICGKAVPLYFYFIRYCILCLILVLLAMSIPITIFNSINLNDINDYCTELKINNITINEKDINVTKICEKYSKVNNSQITNFFNWFSKVSSDNIFDYNNILKFNNKSKSKEGIFINYSIVGFICMISLFIVNIFYIILNKAQIKAEKINNIQPSDYTVLIANLQRFVNEFKEKNEVKELINIESNAEDDLTGGVSYLENNNMNDPKTQIGQFTQYLINNLFYSQKSKQNLNIFHLNLCYKLNDFMILKEMQEKCKYKIFQIENNPYQIEKNIQKNYTKNQRRYFESPFTYIGLDWLYCSNKGIPLKLLNEKKDYYDKNLNSLVTKAKLKNFCGCVFATFNTIEDKEEFYNNFPHFFIENLFYYIKNIKYYLCCCLIEKKNKKKRLKERIKVYLAPEPEDVIWQNMEFTLFQRFYRIIIIYLISFLLIGIAFYAVYKLNNYQDSIEEKNWSPSQKYSASFSITIIIALLNLFFEYIMKFFTKIEKQKSLTNYYLSFSIKLTIFTFMTSALVPFFSNYFTHHHDLKNHENKTLITNIFFIFLTNSFLKPIIWTINVPLIIKKIRICLIERKKIPNSMHFKTQKELNDLYELPEMNIALKYSFISMIIFMTMFYLPIFPLGVPISIAGLTLLYFCEKFNFTRHYKRPEMLNEKLGQFHFNFFIFSILSYCLGDYFFTQGLFENDSWPIVSIFIFGILSIIPYTKPITYYFNSSKEFHVRSKPIKDIYFTFYNDYQRQNPFTKKEGMYFYINELKKRGYISKFIYDILIKNIEKINVMEIYYNTSLNPTLKEAQQSLTKVNYHRISIDDLKRSVTRIIREKLKKSGHKKDEIENREHSKSSNISQRINIFIEKKEKEKKPEIKKENNNEINDNIDDNLNINNLKKENNINTSSNNDSSNSIDIIKDKRRYSEMTKNKNTIKQIYDSNINLTMNISSRGSFLLNQYKDPLLLSIGLGINTLAFMGDSNDSKGNKKNGSKKSAFDNENSNSSSSDESYSRSSSEESEDNIIVEEEKEENEDYYEENEEDEIRKMKTK